MKINKDLIIGDTGKSLYDLTAATKQCRTVSTNHTSDTSVSGAKDIQSITLNQANTCSSHMTNAPFLIPDVQR